MRTEDAVTSADNLELGYAALIAVYILLFAPRSSGSCAGCNERGP